MPNLGPDFDLSVRLKAIEDQLRGQQANPIGQAFSTTQSDGTLGWTVQMEPTTGTTFMAFFQGPDTGFQPGEANHPALLYVGQVYEGGRNIDGGVLIARPDGVHYLASFTTAGSTLWDAAGNAVVGTDETAGEGLSSPTLPIPLPVATGVGSWPKTTTSGSIAESGFVAQHAEASWSGFAITDSGTTGTVQVVVVDGTGSTVASGASRNVTSSSFTTADVVTLPAGFWQQQYTVEVQASVTGGTGNVYCQLFEAHGRPS